jgi:hypothetical protein
VRLKKKYVQATGYKTMKSSSNRSGTKRNKKPVPGQAPPAHRTLVVDGARGTTRWEAT